MLAEIWLHEGEEETGPGREGHAVLSLGGRGHRRCLVWRWIGGIGRETSAEHRDRDVLSGPLHWACS